MTELKVQCDCGQKYKFDVEPVNGQMPFRVSCPVCGVDGTDKANALLQSQAPMPMAAPPAPPLVPSGLRLGVSAPAPVAAAAPPMPAGQRFPGAAGLGRPALAAAPQKASGTSTLALGIVGALIGAGIGAGLMYVFYTIVGFRFPFMGTGTGILTGLGARILYRGTDSALGAISGGIAAAAVVAATYLMYGEFPVTSIFTAVFGIYFAYRIAA